MARTTPNKSASSSDDLVAATKHALANGGPIPDGVRISFAQGHEQITVIGDDAGPTGEAVVADLQTPFEIATAAPAVPGTGTASPLPAPAEG